MAKTANSPYGMLAVGIVLQALKDYQKASEVLEIAPDNTNAQSEQKEIEMFFESDWFQTLRDIAPEAISEHIFEDFKNDSKRVFETGILLGQKNKGEGTTA